MRRRFEIFTLAMFALAVLPGCGGVQPVTGGTPGVLHSGTETYSDMQVTVYRVEGGDLDRIGFAVTKSDGTFELVSNDAEGPLVLTAGEYRCTLESAGAPLQFPRVYSQAETTPLKLTWSSSDVELDLNVPVPQPVR